jgi:hypothetical protein
MRTSTRSLVLLGVATVLVSACSSDVVFGVTPAPTSTTPPPVDPGPAPNAYPGKGFIVHEWGTDTVVVGSDGSLQRGLHHEEEDLPPFVYDRLRAGEAQGATSVHVKMETPVTYFYAEKAMTAKVSVAFPSGVLTQWYPAVRSFYPWVAPPNVVPGLDHWADPALDPAFPFESPMCREKFGAVGQGLLDWGEVEILDRGAEPAMPEAPLETYTWSHARAVDSNAVRITGAPSANGGLEVDKFLFYRGLGNPTLPARVTATASSVRVENLLADPVGALFVVNVGPTGGAFHVFPGGLKGGQSDEMQVPKLESAEPLDAFAESLGEEVEWALEGRGLYPATTGLYRDEALAMVATWKRQWFRTPGLRVFYLAPQSWTDATLPLSVDPAPDSVRRVMMIRVEVITPDLEEADAEAAKGLAQPATEAAAKAHFQALGRFAEPRLRRALSLLGQPAWGEPFLAAIATAETRAAVGE